MRSSIVSVDLERARKRSWPGRLALLMFIAWFWAILRYTYVFQISPVYDYAGLRLHEHPAWVDYTMFLLTLVVGSALPMSGKRASDWAVVLLFMSLVVPVTSLWPVMLDLEPFTLVAWGVLLVLGFAALAISATWIRIPVRGPDRVPCSPSLFWGMVGVALLLGICGEMYLMGWRLNLDWASQYDRRMESREVVPDGSAMAYMQVILRSILIPLGAIGLFAFKRWLLAVPLLVAVVAMFSLDGSKAVLFIPTAIGLVCAVMHVPESRRVFCFAACFPLVVTAAAMEFHLLGSDWLNATFVRRVFAIPAQLTWAHFDWLFNEGPRWFAGCQLGAFWGTRDDVASPRLVGLVYMNNIETNANANIWASGAIELGALGVIITGLIAGCILAYINTVRSHASPVVRVLGAVLCGYIWTQQALHTSLLSSGIALFCVLLLVIPELEEGK